jgi:hypothetical protein
MFLGKSHKHFLPCFKLCYLEAKVEKDSLWALKRKETQYLIFQSVCLKCFVLNTRDNLNAFDSNFDFGIFLGYSSCSKAYRVYNNKTFSLEESMHVVFEETQNEKIDEILDDVN